MTHLLTRDRPKLRKLLSYCYFQNLLVAGLALPLFNLVEKNWKKSIRGSLVLCAFSLANDLFIEHKREALFTERLSQEEIVGRKIAIGVEWVRDQMKDLKLKPGREREKQRLLGFDWEGLENLVRINETARYDVESLREEQMEVIRKEMQKGFQDFKRFM